MMRQISEIERIKRGVVETKANIKWLAERVKDIYLKPLRADNRQFGFKDQELIKFWDFNQANNGVLSSYPMEYKYDPVNDFNNWFVTCDSDFDYGFSEAKVDISPAGYALFHGNLDITIPKDGKHDRTGYAFFGSIKNKRQVMFAKETVEFTDVTHLCMRVRGDGRKYHIIFDTSDWEDISWFDRYQYMLYTHGGPYWQNVRIPLSRFFFQYQGCIQDEQYKLEGSSIKSVGILAVDNFSGPFSLEIDYIGFMSDSQWNDDIEYESYYHEHAQLKK